MARAASEIDTPAKRARLEPRRNPYFQGISGGRGGVSLGYRKPTQGPGAWVAKLVVEKRRVEERIAGADDAKAEANALSYRAAVTAALAWAKLQYARIEDAAEDGADRAAPTVRSAVEAYGAQRTARLAKAGRDAVGRLRKHVLADEAFAGTKLSRLSASGIQAWRRRLSADLAPATVNRLLNDLRAALNAGAELDRRSLPAGLPGEIRAGTKAISVAPSARKQILSDADVRRLVDAAFAIDPEGDVGRLMIVAAATGARFSQLARITVADVQPDRERIMVPVSLKGREGAKSVARIAVPVGADVIASLGPALAGRRGHEALLLRWVHKQVGPAAWERLERRPWQSASEILRSWARIRETAGLPGDTIPLALRHSSIVRGLRAGLPVRLVAALHDTSVAMIEAHYAAFIVDATEELARRAVMPLAPVGAAPLRVVGTAA